jgi:hypothetical protein
MLVQSQFLRLIGVLLLFQIPFFSNLKLAFYPPLEGGEAFLVCPLSFSL